MHFTIVAFNIQVEGLSQDDEFTGRTIYCHCVRAGLRIPATWELTQGQQYAAINSNGKIDINTGVQNKTLTISCTVDGHTETKTITISYDNQFIIEGSDTMTGTVGNLLARYNDSLVSPVWSITSGNNYATIDALGEVSITATGNITVQATYNGYTATKQIRVVYQANTTTTTTVDDEGNVTTETSTVVEHPDGTTTTT